ncbi:MAG: CocE/NonD family hydrolase, partial [Planctomycetota bacterium]
MGNGYRITRYRVPMRDGVEIATDVVFPGPLEEGPWPVLLFRTPYGRSSSIERAEPTLRQGIAYVAQDFRGLWDSDGEFDFFAHEIDDGTDSVAWVRAQPWCNGKIAMKGGSGPGMGAKLAMLGAPEGLVAASTSVAASNIHQYVLYQGGVMRAHMNDTWRRGQGIEVQDWPRPRTASLTDAVRDITFARRADRIDTALYDVTGWFDIFLQSSLDDFEALHRVNPNTRLVIGGRGHGRMDGLPTPPGAMSVAKSNAWTSHWLKGTQPGVMNEPPVRYYLMGDLRDEWAPGNVWKEADTWPVPHRPTPFYFHADGR